jgi:hypothetical protein
MVWRRGVRRRDEASGVAIQETTEAQAGPNGRQALTGVGTDLEALRRAMRSGHVSFHQVATAWFRSRQQEDVPAAQRAHYERLFPRLLEVFSARRGGIVTACFCEHIRVAAALTNIDVAAARKSDPLVDVHAVEDVDGLLFQAVTEEDEETGRPQRRRRFALGRHGRRRRRLPPVASNSAIHLEPSFGDPDSWKAKEILFACLELHYRAIEFLDPKQRKICTRMVFSVIAALLGTLDRRAGDGDAAASFDRESPESRWLAREVARAKAYYRQSAERKARREYLGGMAIGLGGFGALAVAIVAGFMLFGDVRNLDEPVLVTLLAGALGAGISVLTRMTAGNLPLNYEAGRFTLCVLGAVRPVIGAISGLAIYVLIEGGLLAFAAPPGGAPPALYYAGLAFVAGFSERLAQDIFDGVRPAGRGGPPPAAPDVLSAPRGGP